MTTLQPGAAPANTRTPVTEQPSKAVASNNVLTRRAAIAGLTTGAATVAFAASPAVAAIGSVTDPRWAALVADYRAKYAAWLDEPEIDEKTMSAFREARASLPPEPQKPSSRLPEDIMGMTLAEIHAIGDAPEYKALWAAYECDHAAWKAQQDALHEKFWGAGRARDKEASDLYTAAYERLMRYRVRTLAELREKIEIIAAENKDYHISCEELDHVLADVQHLGGEA